MTRKFLLVLLVLALALAVVGCDSAGAGGDDADSSQDATTGDGTTDDGTTTNVPEDVPNDSTSAVDGSGYGYLALDYFGGPSGGPYNTDVFLFADSNENAPVFYLELFDQTATPAVDAGTYTLDTSGSLPSDGDITYIVVVGPGSEANFSYAASSEGTKSEFEGATSLSVDVYDQINSGTVTISVSGSVYTFSWSLSTADGDTLEGSYSGAVDETN